MMVGWIWAGGILLIGSIYDVKSYSLPKRLVVYGLIGGFAGMMISIIGGEDNWLNVAGRLFPGIVTLGLAFLTKEQIGYGDGFMLLMLGGCVGREELIGIWFGGLLVSFLISVILLIFRKAAKNTKIPFVPCLFMGYIVVVAGGIGNAL